MILGSVGFILAREHMSYGTDGKLHFDPPWAKSDASAGEDAPSGEVIIQEPERSTAEAMQGTLLPAAPLTAETLAEAKAQSTGSLVITLKDDTGAVYFDSAAALAGTVSTADTTAAALAELTEDTVTSFYDSLRGQGLSARSVWCVHLLLRRCMDEAARDQRIPYNPVRLCREPKAEEYKTAPLRLGQLQRYLNAAEQLGILPIIYTGLSSGLRQCELITLSWADFHVRYRYILKGQRLLTLNAKAERLLKQIPETDSPYVFLNPKTEAPYKLHEFYYLHKKILKQARLPWVAFRDLQRQCMEVGI